MGTCYTAQRAHSTRCSVVTWKSWGVGVGRDVQEGNDICLLTVALENTLESPLDCKEIKQVNSKGNQPWKFFGRTDEEAEAPILWPPDTKSQFIGKDSDAGEGWRQKEKRVAEDEMVEWHYWLSRHEFEIMKVRGAWSPWGHKESDTT